MISKKQRNIILYILAIVIIILLIITITTSFSFMTPEGDENGYFPFEIRGKDTVSLVTNIEDNINLSPGTYDMASTEEHIVMTKNIDVTLNNIDDNTNVSDDYNLHINVSKNTFVKTNSTHPEIILTVTDSSNSVVSTTIKGLSYVTVDGVSGYDITDFTGRLLFTDTISITDGSNSKTENYTVTITFMNYTTDQTVNNNALFESSLEIDTEYSDNTLSSDIVYHNGKISYIESRETPNFSQIAATNEGMFATSDNYGTSYYFRGTVDDNWVYFAGFYWRIVRINGDGSVRMIYTGERAPIEIEKIQIEGSETTIGVNDYAAHNKLWSIGYMYTENEQFGFSDSSSIKLFIDTWYENNLLNKEESSYISDNIFCTDRRSNSPWDLSNLYYTYITDRLISMNINGLDNTCANKVDSFTVSDEQKGNGALAYPIALLTLPEIIHAGANLEDASDFYLDNGLYYFSMTPFFVSLYNDSGSSGRVYAVTNTGTARNLYTLHENHVRPVISIDAISEFTGTGQWDDPYILVS